MFLFFYFFFFLFFFFFFFFFSSRRRHTRFDCDWSSDVCSSDLTEQGRIVADDEIKQTFSTAQPYRQWIDQNMVEIGTLPDPGKLPEPDHEAVLRRQQAFGYTFEDLRMLKIGRAHV